MIYANSASAIILVISLSLVLGLIVVGSLLLYRHRQTHYLKYHAYNRYLLRYEKQHHTNLVNHKIRFKTSRHAYLSNLKDNVENLEIINDAIVKCEKGHKKIADMDAFVPLIDMRSFNDPQQVYLLNELLTLFKKPHQPPNDIFLVNMFGDQCLVNKKRRFFYYHQLLVVVDINNRLAHPRLLKMDNVDIQISKVTDKKHYQIYRLTILYHQQVLLTIDKKIKSYEIEIYDNLLLLAANYTVYAKCSTIKEAITKYTHLQKMNQQTLQKINEMSGLRFLKWMQKTLIIVQKMDFELRQSNMGSYYLYAVNNNNKAIVIQVKRHNDKINSTAIKELKDIQCREFADEAWIITNHTYTKQAKELGQSTNVKLLDNNDVISLIDAFNNNYYQSF